MNYFHLRFLSLYRRFLILASSSRLNSSSLTRLISLIFLLLSIYFNFPTILVSLLSTFNPPFVIYSRHKGHLCPEIKTKQMLIWSKI